MLLQLFLLFFLFILRFLLLLLRFLHYDKFRTEFKGALSTNVECQVQVEYREMLEAAPSWWQRLNEGSAPLIRGVPASEVHA